MQFKVGDRVLVHGHSYDCTNREDGKIGTIVHASNIDCLVRLDCGDPYETWVWNWNMELIESGDSNG